MYKPSTTGLIVVGQAGKGRLFLLYWEITDKGDPDALALVDGVTELLTGRSGFGKPHYSRQTPGSRLFTRNGQNLVFITPDKLAIWVTFRPTPGKAVRPDKRDAWECALFRNESKTLSSLLIKEAVELSCAIWGPIPPDGFITFIRPDKTTYRRSKKSLPGACYRHAGWIEDKPSSDGKPCLSTSTPASIADIREWGWAGDRGGILRKEIEERIKDMALRVMEPQEPYNTKEDYLEIVQVYKELKQNEEHQSPWKRARLAQEAAKQYDLKQLAKDTGENYDVLKNLSGIAGKYSEEDEKKYGITLLFKHFIVAAKADNRLEWLQKAQDNAWSAERLRREMNPPKPKKEPESLPVAKPEPVIVQKEFDPIAPVDSLSLYEIVEVLNYNQAQNPMEIQQWADTYVNLVNSLFAYKTTKRITYNWANTAFEISEADR